MSKTAYHLSLTGRVGGPDFDRSKVDKALSKQDGKQVNVLINSTGGSLDTGLTISAAFRNHGNVNVHFVGLNASAATIASMGAKHISMDAGAMYLVHQCSTTFFEWGSMNASEFDTLIKACEKVREDLNKIDASIATQYAARCKRTPDEMLELMKKGGWLSAQEALEWGFIDEITEFNEDVSAEADDMLVAELMAEGIPVPFDFLPGFRSVTPQVPDGSGQSNPFSKLLNSLSSFFKSAHTQSTIVSMKNYENVCKTLSCESLHLTDGKASVTDEQLNSIDAALKQKDDTIAEKQKIIDELRAKLDGKPADSSSQVVDDAKKTEQPENDDLNDYVSAASSAHDLFNSLP